MSQKNLPYWMGAKEVSVLHGTSIGYAYRVINEIRPKERKMCRRITVREYCDYFKVDYNEAVEVLKSRNIGGNYGG